MPLITVQEFISSLSEKEQRDVQVLSDQLTGVKPITISGFWNNAGEIKEPRELLQEGLQEG